MKKLLLLSIIACTLFACTQQSGPSFKIDGKIAGVKKGKVFLQAEDLSFADTATIENGEFTFKGSVKEPCFCILTVGGVDGKKGFYIENSKITFEADVKSLRKAVVTGSVMENDRKEYWRRLKVIDEKHEYDKYNEEWDTASDERKAELLKLFEVYDAEVLAAKKQFVKDHPASYLSTLILYDFDSSFKTADEFFSFISHLDPSLDGYSYLEKIKKVFNQLKAIEIGQMAPDFTMNDVNGNLVTMSEICKQSKYLLIDFWSSGCGPCRRENPNIVKAYNRFHSKGLNILGVSTEDIKEDWLRAIEEDGLNKWDNVCNLKKWNDNEIVNLYALRQSSENVLLDNTGKIIFRNVKGEELQQKLEELMN